MKKFSIALLLVVLGSFSAFAQGKKDQIRSLKVAFITKELALTPAEAEKFWPIFNAYEDKQFDIRFRKMREIKEKTEAPAVDKLTDKEATVFLNQLDDAEQELADNRRKLITNLKGVIGPVKILKLKKAEDDFNRKLLRQYRKQGRE